MRRRPSTRLKKSFAPPALVPGTAAAAAPLVLPEWSSARDVVFALPPPLESAAVLVAGRCKGLDVRRAPGMPPRRVWCVINLVVFMFVMSVPDRRNEIFEVVGHWL